MRQSPPNTAPAIDDAPSSHLMSDAHVYSQDPGYIVAVAGRYHVLIVKDALTATGVGLLRRAVADLSERYETFGYLTVLEPSAQLLLAPDIRNNLNTLIKRYTTRFSAAAIVYEKTGFHATAMRSVVTAINFASRAQHPNHVFADVREAISWMARLTPGEPTPSRLYQIVSQLRASLLANPGQQSLRAR